MYIHTHTCEPTPMSMYGYKYTYIHKELDLIDRYRVSHIPCFFQMSYRGYCLSRYLSMFSKVLNSLQEAAFNVPLVNRSVGLGLS